MSAWRLDQPCRLSIVLTNVHSPRGSNAEDGLEERRGVRAEDPDSLKAMLLQVVCQAPCSICKLGVRPPEDLVIGGDMVNRLGLIHFRQLITANSDIFWICKTLRDKTNLRLNCRRPRQEEGRGESMVVKAMLEARLRRFRRKMAQQARKSGLDARHGMRGSWFSLEFESSLCTGESGVMNEGGTILDPPSWGNAGKTVRSVSVSHG